MNKDNQLTSYLLKIGEEVFKLLRAKGATKEDAEDIIQNSYYKIYSLLDELTEVNIRPWFFRVALNDYIDLKRKKEQQNIHLSLEIQSKLTSHEDYYESLLNKEEVMYLLKDIKKDYKEIFFLKYYYDFSYEEIAKLLNMQVDNVKQKLYRARKSIRTEVGGKYSWINPFKKH